MKDDLKKRECALFICRNAELAHFFASWLCNRLANDKEDRDRVLERLYFIFEEEGEEENDTSISQRMYYDEGQETLNCKEVECPANEFFLIIADEPSCQRLKILWKETRKMLEFCCSRMLPKQCARISITQMAINSSL